MSDDFFSGVQGANTLSHITEAALTPVQRWTFNVQLSAIHSTTIQRTLVIIAEDSGEILLQQCSEAQYVDDL